MDRERECVCESEKERDAPVALAAALLLHLLGVGVEVPGLGEVARQVLLGRGGAGGQALVVAVVELVGARHWPCNVSEGERLGGCHGRRWATRWARFGFEKRLWSRGMATGDEGWLTGECGRGVESVSRVEELAARVRDE